MNRLLTLVSNNKHTSIAGIVYLVAKYGCNIFSVWMPQHKDKLDSTANIVEGAAVAYGLFAAGDASQGATQKQMDAVQNAVVTGDTSHLKKTDVEPKP